MAEALCIGSLTLDRTPAQHVLAHRSFDDAAAALRTMKARAILSGDCSSASVPSGNDIRPTLNMAYHVANALPGAFLRQLDALRLRVPLDNSRPTCPRRFFQVNDDMTETSKVYEADACSHAFILMLLSLGFRLNRSWFQ